MKNRKGFPSFLFLAVCMGIMISGTPVFGDDPGNLLFLSTQLTPFDEAEKMQSILKKGFPRAVTFKPNDNRLIFSKVVTGFGGAGERPDLIGGIHGDFSSLKESNVLMDLAPLLPGLKENRIIDKYIDIARIKTDAQDYIPWMQATYIMVASKKALPYLPKGADINRLTYEELLVWAKNIKAATGKGGLGFPGGEKGLMHRFLQGCLYPSYTGTMVSGFQSPEALEMWTYLRELWGCVNQWSLSFTHMEEPLLSEEVWIAWDHTARLVNIFKEKPDEFIAFPCPSGPKGRGFMVVLAGLAIPEYSDNYQEAQSLIRFLTRPETQYQMLNQIGFFPVVDLGAAQKLSQGMQIIYKGVVTQSNSPDALVAMLPSGLGQMNKTFNTAYLVAFSQIILREKEIPRVLTKQAQRLNHIFKETGAPCWPPDKTGTQPCRVKSP